MIFFIIFFMTVSFLMGVALGIQKSHGVTTDIVQDLYEKIGDDVSKRDFRKALSELAAEKVEEYVRRKVPRK